MARALTVRAPQWWKHLRPYWKRVFWKRERKAAIKAVKKEAE